MNVIGKTIGNRYEIIKEVGSGGMATVYKAKDHVLNRNVAVKVLRDEYTTDADFIKRFNTEAQAAANMQHPNIVSIYDVGHEEENNLYYIVMELIKGKTLKQIINKDGVLSWKWSINIAIQIASALELAHKNNIVHRDIKPHNIIITEDGVAKVTDFGIAKAVSNSTITAFGNTIGSAHYFSPEQAKGSVTTDERSDLYSLGVVMYEMITGKVPFEADTPVAVALKHMQEDPVEPIDINDEIPSAVNDIVMKAMQKDPINRYQSASEMLADLSEALKDPDGDFVIIENKDGGYTRIMPAVSDDDINNSKTRTQTKEKNGFFQKHPKAKIALVLLGLIALFITVFMITKLVLDGGGKKKVDIPDLSGKTQAEAQKIVDNLNLLLEIGEAQSSSTVEEGKVISQDPEYKKDAKIEEGAKIKIVLSKGPETNDLPNFVDQNIDDVRKKAKELGIELEETQENNSTINEGLIISQDPKPDTKVKSGDKVKVVISAGTKKTKVPTVVGMDEGTATATLKNSSLKVNVSYKSDESKENGKVISQSIDQGKEVAEGTTVDIVVNKKEEKKQRSVTLEVTVPKSSNNSSESTNNTNSGDSSVTLSVLVNGKSLVSERTSKPGETVNCGKITGTADESKEIKVQVDGKTVKTKSFTMDEYADGGTVSVN